MFLYWVIGCWLFLTFYSFHSTFFSSISFCQPFFSPCAKQWSSTATTPIKVSISSSAGEVHPSELVLLQFSWLALLAPSHFTLQTVASLTLITFFLLFTNTFSCSSFTSKIWKRANLQSEQQQQQQIKTHFFVLTAIFASHLLNS